MTKERISWIITWSESVGRGWHTRTHIHRKLFVLSSIYRKHELIWEPIKKQKLYVDATMTLRSRERALFLRPSD